MGGDRAARGRARGGSHRIRQDACGIPVGYRPVRALLGSEQAPSSRPLGASPCGPRMRGCEGPSGGLTGCSCASAVTTWLMRAGARV